MKNKLFVFDTNSFVSAALIKNSVNARALDKAFRIGQIAVSNASFLEFTEVIYRPKFDKYLDNERRHSMLNRIEQDAIKFQVEEFIKVCRDPKDDKFLELAVTCQAACIISGDKDLLILNPFRDIPIMTAAEFLKQF